MTWLFLWMTNMNAAQARKRLKSFASPEAARAAAKYFKTAPGEYGAGDRFLGVKVPYTRTVSREFRDLPLDEVEGLLLSKIHEERLLGLLILELQFKRGDGATQQGIYDFYVAHLPSVNNWDLVDSSAPSIVGGHLSDKSRKPLLGWARSEVLWERRIAIIATLHFIRNEDFAETLKISRLLLNDPHDLIHKGTGWMLREVGKRHEPTLVEFLDEHARRMPRTMLRYAIERFPEQVRKDYLLNSR